MPVSWTDLCLHLDGLTEQLDRCGTFDQGAAQRAHRLIAHEQDGALRPPQIVLEVWRMRPASHMPLAERMTLGTRSALIIRDSSLVTRDLQTRKVMGSMPLGQQSAGIRVKAVGVGIFEDAGRLDGKRAVNVHREVAVPR